VKIRKKIVLLKVEINEAIIDASLPNYSKVIS